MYINIIVYVLGFILLILGIIGFRKPGKKNKIIVVIGILVLVLNFYNENVKKSKEEEFMHFKNAVSYEIQKLYLNRINKGLSKSEIENLGRDPLLKQAYEKGQKYERMGSFKKAIESYNEIIIYSLSSDGDRVSAYNLIGLCYLNLYEPERAKQNFKKAEEKIENLKDKKHKLYTKAKTLHNIGCAFKELMQWENALKYFEDSLKETIKLDDNLIKADTLYSISLIYFQLNKPKIAIEKLLQCNRAYQEALKVYTLDNFPMDYAMIQNNLGNTYRSLAKVKDRVVNCEKAIQAFHEALKVYTPEDFPMNYAITQNNLGTAFGTLAEVQDKAENCNLAIQYYLEALKVYTLDNFPMDYAMIQNNLGNTYRSLAKVKDRVVNCEKAIQAFHEALKVYTPEDFPMNYAITQNNLGTAFGTLAEVEDKAGNCNKAIQAFKEALSVYTKEEFPEVYRIIKENIKNVYEL